MTERRTQAIIKDFTLYLNNGTRKVITGTTLEDALMRSGMVGENLPSLERWDVGITDTHQWCQETKMWYRTKL